MAYLCLAFPNPGSAQSTLGAQVAWGADAGLGLGLRAELPVPEVARGVYAMGSADFFFPEGYLADQLDVNAGLQYPVTLSDLAVYVGGGINVQRISAAVFAERDSGIHVGLALWGGARFGSEGMRPFVELRSELSRIAQIVLSAGVLF